MAGEELVDVRYRGLRVGESLAMREFGATTAYLEAPDPMPVGTVLEITNDRGEAFTAKVVKVQEKTDSAPNAGMRVAVADVSASVKSWWQANVTVTEPAGREPETEAVPETVSEGSTPARTQVMAAVDLSQIEAMGAAVSSDDIAEREAEAAAAGVSDDDEPDEDGHKKRRGRRKKRNS
jgi:hypothetical protein